MKNSYKRMSPIQSPRAHFRKPSYEGDLFRNIENGNRGFTEVVDLRLTSRTQQDCASTYTSYLVQNRLSDKVHVFQFKKSEPEPYKVCRSLMPGTVVTSQRQQKYRFEICRNSFWYILVITFFFCQNCICSTCKLFFF